jgi:hypothetical protein
VMLAAGVASAIRRSAAMSQWSIDAHSSPCCRFFVKLASWAGQRK